MKFSTITLNTCLAAATLLVSTSDAYSSNVPQVTPVTQSNVLDTNADVAMSQYEAALKAAFEQASAPVPAPEPASESVPAVSSPIDQQQHHHQYQQQYQQVAAVAAPEAATESPTVLESVAPTTILLNHVQEQEEAIDQYETALKAALEAASRVEETETPAAAEAAEPSSILWESISDDISFQIEEAESKIGGTLSAAAKGEIVGNVLAGSAVLGTAAINSPILMGAALAYASTHILGGKRGEDLARVSKDALRNALSFTQTQLEEEQGDISKASVRIMQHIQHEAQDRAKKVQRVAQDQAHHVSREISDAPTQLVEEGKRIVTSDEFKQMPNRTFKAVQAFLGSDEVKRAKESVVKSIKDGLESEELKAVKARATRSLKDI